MAVIRNRYTEIGRFRYLLISLIILIIADGVITNALVQSGLGREGNPFLRAIVGGTNFLTIKAIGAFLCAAILWDIYRHWKRLAVVSSVCFVAVYSGIVIWNLSLFFIS